jgi:hypothetical protein
MKQTLMITILCLAIAAMATAQQKPADQATKPPAAMSTTPMPTVDQILDKYVQALGGKAAIEKITSMSAKGSIDIPTFGASGTVEIWGKAPNKNGVRLDIAGFGIVQEGFNGTVAFAQDPQSGLREKTGAELAGEKLDSEFNKPLKLKQLYGKITVKGKDKVADKEAYVLEATPADSPTETWYFDAASGLLVRSDIQRESPQGKVTFQIYQEDYKEVDGVKVPHTIRNVSEAISFTLKLDEVKHNVAIDDTKFNKPATQ